MNRHCSIQIYLRKDQRDLLRVEGRRGGEVITEFNSIGSVKAICQSSRGQLDKDGAFLFIRKYQQPVFYGSDSIY